MAELTGGKQEHRKTKFASVEERAAAGEFGDKILHTEFDQKLCILGEDNVFLGQTNNYSVVTDRRNCIVAAANI